MENKFNNFTLVTMISELLEQNIERSEIESIEELNNKILEVEDTLNNVKKEINHVFNDIKDELSKGDVNGNTYYIPELQEIALKEPRLKNILNMIDYTLYESIKYGNVTKSKISLDSVLKYKSLNTETLDLLKRNLRDIGILYEGYSITFLPSFTTVMIGLTKEEYDLYVEEFLDFLYDGKTLSSKFRLNAIRNLPEEFEDTPLEYLIYDFISFHTKDSAKQLITTKSEFLSYNFTPNLIERANYVSQYKNSLN